VKRWCVIATSEIQTDRIQFFSCYEANFVLLLSSGVSVDVHEYRTKTASGIKITLFVSAGVHGATAFTELRRQTFRPFRTAALNKQGTAAMFVHPTDVKGRKVVCLLFNDDFNS
jgi:hypothetical protein